MLAAETVAERQRGAERGPPPVSRAAHYQNKLCLQQSRHLVQLLEKQIAQCEKAMTTLIAAEAPLQAQADRLDAIQRVGVLTNGFGFNLKEVPNQRVLVEALTNRQNWQPPKTNTFSSSLLYFSDFGNRPARFYCARLVP